MRANYSTATSDVSNTSVCC